MFYLILIGLTLSAFVMTWFLTRLLIIWLPNYGLIDYPGPRRNHIVPTVRGGGIAIVFTVMLLVPLVVILLSGSIWPFLVLSGMCLVALISLKDDLKHVAPWVRLCVQFIAAWIAICYINTGTLLGGFFVPWVDRLLVTIMWVIFMNFFNFMDGIDGISSIETCIIAFGVLCISLILGNHIDACFSVILVGSSVGFLYWNKTPAKIFLGDVGSVSLGYMLGALLIRIASQGHLASSLILPAYYIADSGVAVLFRMWRLNAFWEPHQDFFHHRAYLRGLSHWLISTWVFYCGIGLIFLSVIAIFYPIFALIVTIPYVAIFCRFLAVGRIKFS